MLLEMLELIQRYRVTGIYTAPTAYRAMSAIADQYDLSRECFSLFRA